MGTNRSDSCLAPDHVSPDQVPRTDALRCMRRQHVLLRKVERRLSKMKRISGGFLHFAVLALVLMVMLTIPARAGTFTVNTTSDGSGVCTTDPATNGVCTLRAAIQAAVALGGSNAIILPAGTYVLSQPSLCAPLATVGLTTLCPTGNLTIAGAGAQQTVIDGNAQGRVFFVTGAGTNVALNGVTVRNGGGGVAIGGGIYNTATLSLTDSVILGNTGGGIYNTGTLTLLNCTVSGNFGSGGIDNSAGTVLFSNGTMSNNSATHGGGAALNSGGTFTVTGSTITGNSTFGPGGAFFNVGGASDNVIQNAILTLINSTVVGNSSSTHGGAIYNNFNGVFVSEVNLNNVTISNNTSGNPGGGIFNIGTVNLKNTILAANNNLASGADDCSTSNPTVGLNSEGYNLIGNAAGCTIGGVTTGNIIGQDPKLDALANNGGPTQTMALLPGSPAIDAGNPAIPGTGGGACAVTDQRGLFRPFGEACDIGAFERFGGLAVSDVLPNRAGNSGSVVTVISGSAFTSGAQVKLTQASQADIVGNPVSVDPGGSAIGTAFDLTGAALGAWNVVVTNPGGSSASLPGGFTVGTVQAPQLWVDLVGPPIVRPGLPANFILLFGNTGSVDATGVSVGVSIPQNFGFNLQFPTVDPPPQAGQVIADWTGVPINALTDSQGFTAYPLFLPVVPAGFTSALPFQLLVPTTAPLGQNFLMLAGINQPYFNPALDPQVVNTILAGAHVYAQQNLGVTIPPSLDASLTQYLTNQLQSAVASGRDALVASGARQIQPYSLGQMLIDLAEFGAGQVTASSIKPTRFARAENIRSLLDPGAGDMCVVCTAHGEVCPFGCSCTNAIPPCPPPAKEPPSKPINPTECQNMAGYVVKNGVCVPDGCKPFLNTTCAPKNPDVNNSGDPNDKVGAQGVGSAHYVDGDTPLRYDIAFTNEATASAPAQVVVVTDQLDTSQLDLSTFSMGLISFGSVSMLPPPGSSHFVGGVDLTPLGQNVIVRVDANLDKSTGLLTWQFTSLDPLTLQLTQNPLGGFLPPDTNPPNGEGHVLFTVQAKPGLSTGAQIQNQAQVVFDFNAPINTPVWTNTIDVTPPATHVLALPATESSTSFPVQWTGTDAGSGVQGFTIYASDNGGPFTIFQNDTSATSATFTGQVGHSYGFYSIGQDFVGNVEAAKTVAEATTQVVQATCASDVSSQVSVTRSGYGYNFATGRFVQTVTLKNSGSGTIAGPISLVLDSLSGNAALFNSSGRTACAVPAGSPLINLGSSLAAGASVTVQLQFTDPSKTGISYSTRVLAGSGNR